MKALALAFTLALVALPAHAANKHKRAYQAQIACTQFGCMQVPRGCYRESGRTADGDPSGFDVITCGGGAYTMYGNRY
jgi:hypothetical protein